MNTTNEKMPSDQSKMPNGELLASGPSGIDIGTANIVVAQKTGKREITRVQLNAFYTLPYSRMTELALLNEGGMFVKANGKIHALGYQAENFANIVGGIVKRPIAGGILNAKEEDTTFIIQALLNKLIADAPVKNTKICFNIPGSPIDDTVSVFYHEAIIKKYLEQKGYQAEPVNEGLAVVLSELAVSSSNQPYTGIGISLGGGMCNVCFAYLAVPVVTYSIRKGGDYIDAMTAEAVGETPGKVRIIKETQLNLTKTPVGKIETGLHIYYEQLFGILVKSLQTQLGSTDRIPLLRKGVPIVLSGGVAMSPGAKEKFKLALDTVRLPIVISDIILAKQPLLATARGALKNISSVKSVK
ncbi:hypothetical protein QUF75_12035 [Desulfococcaceae bacterium HSG7]|nr:hypothetical protein [Desulfococcaceae bacterium HSG7]